MADNEITITENVKVESRVSLGQIGNQAAASPLMNVQQRTISGLRTHGEVFRRQDIADGAVLLRSPGPSGVTDYIDYMVLYCDKAIDLDFNQGGAKTIRIGGASGGFFMLNNVGGLRAYAFTATAITDDTNIRCFWAAAADY